MASGIKHFIKSNKDCEEFFSDVIPLNSDNHQTFQSTIIEYDNDIIKGRISKDNGGVYEDSNTNSIYISNQNPK